LNDFDGRTPQAGGNGYLAAGEYAWFDMVKRAANNCSLLVRFPPRQARIQGYAVSDPTQEERIA
jgi:hypothetical protein